MKVQELVFATHGSNVALFIELSNALVDDVDKYLRLNINAARFILFATHGFTQQALSFQDPSEWLTLQDGIMVHAAAQVQSYNRLILDLAAAAQASLVRCTQAKLEACGEHTKTLLKAFAKHAPHASEPLVAALDSAITASNELCGSWQKTARQLVDVAPSNIDMATSAATRSAKHACEPAKQTTKR